MTSNIDDVLENMEKATIEAIKNLKEETIPLLDDLSKKELKRVVINLFNFPEPIKIEDKTEVEVLKNIYALKDMQLQLSIQAIGRVQQEKENENE